MSVVFVTCTSKNYARPWICPTLGMLSCRVVCLLGPGDDRPLPVNAERHPYTLPADALHQTGAFLGAVPGLAGDDVVVLADADAVLQRDFSPGEMAVLESLPERGLAMGYNMYPGQRGEAEYRALQPAYPLARAAEILGLPASLLWDAPVWNTGLMAGRPAAWRALSTAYRETFGNTGGGLGLFKMYSWVQYLVCLACARHGIPVAGLGYETHSHGHFGLTEKHRIEHRRLSYGGRLVLFAHLVAGVSY